MQTWYKKLKSFLVTFLLIAQVFITPLHVFAQSEESSISAIEVESTSSNEMKEEASVDESESIGKEESLEQNTGTLLKQQEEDILGEAVASLSMRYTTTTIFEINGNPVQNNAQYGEGKFYITPTFTFPDNTMLNDGDVISYTIPEVFKADGNQETNIVAADGTTIGRLETVEGSKVATVTVTNAAYFVRLNEDKKITSSFTVVWDHDVVELNTPVTFNLEGYPNPLTLTRIRVDDELNIHSKWGSQSSQDLSIINWNIRINRDVKPIGMVTLHDIIPENQELVGVVTGLYFDSWNAEEQRGNYLPVGQREFDSDLVQVKGNEFTINLGDMSTKGVLLSYQTRIVGPIDKVNKKVYNKLTITSNEGTITKDDWFAPLRVVDAVAAGSRSDVISLEVKKELTGRSLKAGEFEFELVNPENNQVLDTVKNTADGIVKFDPIRFNTVGEYVYKIKEKENNLPGITNDKNEEITATVTVTDSTGIKKATVKYDRDKFINNYSAKAVTVSIPVVKKVLQGKDLEVDKYSFELKNGNVVKEIVKNEANGEARFTALTFEKAGTYEYTISEVRGIEKGVTYDDTVYTVKVTVTDNGTGQLAATTDLIKSGIKTKDIVFTNVYTAPEDINQVPQTPKKPEEFNSQPKKVEKQLPKTGEFNSKLFLLVALLVMMVAAVTLTSRKKNN